MTATSTEVDTWRWVVDEAVKPHLPTIRSLTLNGDIACVLYLTKPHSEMAESMGYDGLHPVFRLSNKLRKQYVSYFRERKNKDIANWLARKATNRILLIVDENPLPLNIETDGIDFEASVMGLPLRRPIKAEDFMTKLLEGLK